MAWTRCATEEQRADAAFTLAWAYRYIADPDELHADLEICLAAILDDPSPAVRLALAEGIAGAPDAPRHVVIALADDRPDIASVVLGHSRVLTEAELAQYALAGEERVRLAIACRPDLSPVVAACLVDRGGGEVAAALAKNTQIVMPPAILRRMSERFSGNRMVRRALFERSDLPALVRCDLIEAAAADAATQLAASDLNPARIEKITRTATSRGVVRAANARPAAELCELVRHLRTRGALTISLLIRALVSGEQAFFEAGAAELAGLPMGRVGALVRNPIGAGFAALLRRAGLPFYCLAPLRAALVFLKHHRPASRGRVVRPLVSGLIDTCRTMPEPEIGALIALLRSLEKEAALEDARAVAQEITNEFFETQPREEAPQRSDPRRAAALLERLNLLETSRTEIEPLPAAMAS